MKFSRWMSLHTLPSALMLGTSAAGVTHKPVKLSFLTDILLVRACSALLFAFAGAGTCRLEHSVTLGVTHGAGR
jgi:hypothetical protein